VNPKAVLALWAADDADAATTGEFARVATAAAAAGLAVALLDVRRERARGTPLPDEVQRHLDALAAVGTRRQHASPATLRAALLASQSLLRLASPARSSSPPLLHVTDAWIHATPDADLVRALCEAGQVVRA
jgi:hypothetical protein